MIDTKIIVGISIVVTAAAYVLETRLKRKKKDEPSFQRKGALLSPAERALFDVLDQAIGNQGRVFGMVRVADVLDLERGPGAKAWQPALHQIQSMHFDFVICEPESMGVICAIELHGDAHAENAWKERDAFLAAACASAGLPLIQLPWQQRYDVSEIRSLVLSRLAAGAMDRGGEASPG